MKKKRIEDLMSFKYQIIIRPKMITTVFLLTNYANRWYQFTRTNNINIGKNDLIFII